MSTLSRRMWPQVSSAMACCRSYALHMDAEAAHAQKGLGSAYGTFDNKS